MYQHQTSVQKFQPFQQALGSDSFRDSPWGFTPPKCTLATPLSPVKTPRQFINTVNHFLGFYPK